ncbi:MAG: S8 family serine peptidase [Rhodobacteraceae bacterium]|nr:S8 family serine peptidase [Paracoccaceae bacterium]
MVFDEVRYEVVADENAEFTRFRAGDLDVTNTVPEQRFEELARDTRSGLQHRATLATFYLTFNTNQGPLARSPQLREALSLATGREAITASVTRAGQVPAYSLVPEGVWNYTPAQFAWRSQPAAERKARAQALYRSAGFSAQRPLKLRLLYNENELVQRVCVAIAAMWKEALGVEVELVQMEFKAYLAARADPAQWDVVRVGWTADYNDASTFLDTMIRGSPQNFGRWHDDRYAALLAAAAVETDASARRALLQQAEALMLQDHPLLPVYFYVTRRLVQPDIAAPGTGIRSSIRNNQYASFSGTSMAGPHVAGVAALLMSVDPTLIGDPDRVEQLIKDHALPITSAQNCGSFPGAVVPNAVFGHGRIDAFASVSALLAEMGIVHADGFE